MGLRVVHIPNRKRERERERERDSPCLQSGSVKEKKN